MDGRRQPLAVVPNAANSPFRHHVPTSNGKRRRPQGDDSRTAILGQPPAKKQVIEIPDDDIENVDPQKRAVVVVTTSGKQDEPFMKRASNAQPTPFARKLASVREKKTGTQPHTERQLKTSADNVETIRQWKRHYKKQFPQFVFYFDGVSDEVRRAQGRQVVALGARTEKFFSKVVTHVITTRPIPAELVTTSPDEDARYNDNATRTSQQQSQTQASRKSASLLDANLQRRAQSQHALQAGDLRPQTGSGDLLSRARELGIKIWALEKLQRILKTMFETDPGDQSAAQDIRNHAAVHKTATKPKDADLEQLLRNEKVNGPTDRDMTVATQEMVPFKGYYIYVHDMDERTRPVMHRDYERPEKKEDGKWPQFRLTPEGRCPFVEDANYLKRLRQQEAQERAEAERLHAAQRRTRAGSASLEPPRAPADREVNLRRSPRKSVQATNGQMAKPLDPPTVVPTKRNSSTEGMPALFGSAQQSLRGLPRTIGGEPMASGMQRSNVTSAIRSQAISSQAISSTAPGVNKRVNDTKEISALKRQVLDRNASATSNHSMPSSYMNDVRAAINDDNTQPPQRAAKRKAQETLGVVYEDDEDTRGRHQTQRRAQIPKRRKSAPKEKEPKPGYCENCRDKFEDFDEHILSRKHRKFALTPENWSELDSLLVQLKRPHRIRA